MAKEKIVVIDDSPIVRKLAELALEEEGYKVYTAEDGEEGLRISEEVLPSVILVDFIMPRISGYQFCKSARENELLKDIPIILITGKGEDVGKKFAEKFGVVDYFIKPFKSEMLVDKVNTIINAQRLQTGEEEPVLDTLQWSSAEEEAPAYSFEGAAEVEAPRPSEASEMLEIPEITEASGEFEFEVPDFPEEVLSDNKEVEVPPILSFDEVATMEEPQPLAQGGEVEIDLGMSSFDFNLEGFATQQIVTEGEERPDISSIAETTPEFAENFDFESVEALKEMAAAEDAKMQPISVPVDGFAETAVSSDTEGTVDRILRRYFSDELPLMIEKSVEDVLKRHSIIKPTAILFSGSLQEIAVVEILKLIASSRLTGKFFAFSSAGSAEIYFDHGLVAYAVTSRHSRSAESRQGHLDKSAEGLSELMTETLSMMADLSDGGFFFEKMDLPAALLDFPGRMDVVALLLNGIRRGNSGIEVAENIGSDMVFSRKVGDVQSCGLNDEELRIFTLADGIRTVGDIVGLSGLKSTETKKILGRLAKASVLYYKGGL